MLGPMITQDSIDRSPWWFRALFYTMCIAYLAVGSILIVISYPINVVKHVWKKIT